MSVCEQKQSREQSGSRLATNICHSNQAYGNICRETGRLPTSGEQPSAEETQRAAQEQTENVLIWGRTCTTHTEEKLLRRDHMSELHLHEREERRGSITWRITQKRISSRSDSRVGLHIKAPPPPPLLSAIYGERAFDPKRVQAGQERSSSVRGRQTSQRRRHFSALEPFVWEQSNTNASFSFLEEISLLIELIPDRSVIFNQLTDELVELNTSQPFC